MPETDTTAKPAPRCSRALPTFDEVPALQAGHSRNHFELLRLALIPPDDAELRAAAVTIVRTAEAEGNARDGDAKPDPDETNQLFDLPGVPARTPGGMAWKISEALAGFGDLEAWSRWHPFAASRL